MNSRDNTNSLSSANQSLKREMSNVGRHSAIYVLAPALSKMIGFLLFPLYTRYLSVDIYGTYALIDIVISFAIIVFSMNIADALTRFYFAATDESTRRRIVSTIFLGVAIFTLPIALLCMFFAPWLADFLRIEEKYLAILRLAFLVAWFSVLAELGFAYLRLRYRAKTFLAVTILQVAMIIAFNLLFVAELQMGIRGILISTTIVQAIIGVCMFCCVVGSNLARPSLSRFSEFARFSLPLVPATVAQQLNNYVHPLMLQYLLTDPFFAAAQVGIFSVGQKTAGLVNRFVVVPLNGYWNPRKMELILQGKPEDEFAVGRICTYATLLATSFGLVLSLTIASLFEGLDVAGWISDPEYLKAPQVVPLVALAYVVHSLEHHFATGMHVAKKTRAAMWIAFLSLACVLCVNWVLMPKIGFLAAGFSVLVGATIRSVLYFLLSQKYRPLPFEFRRLLIGLLVAIIFYVAGSAVSTESTIVTLLVRLAFGLLYIPLLWLVGFFDVDENQQILKSVQRIVDWAGKPIRRLTKSFY